ncbi:aldehyde dehydrogenase family protein [Nocardia sp. NPDC005825]|uniref:aldehyde dehydrogenase family protein n=1 Tax=unclassified Nocardia TaxID=2637762 RepID=UPI0033DB4242
MTTSVTGRSSAHALPDPLTRAKASFASGRTRDLAWRQRQLDGIIELCREREDEIAAALALDLGRAPAEAWIGDIVTTVEEAEYARRHVRSWMKRRRQRIPVAQLPGRAWIQYEPLGVVLIISAWNFPVYLALGPLVAAVAAGNCAVIKPSELAPATSNLLARLVPLYLDPDAVLVVEGGAETSQDLLARAVDHVLFTGSTAVGRRIMAAAAPTLTPVTLELGGKSPVIVTADADLGVAARRITWGRMLNSGQACVAPDYVLAEESIKTELVRRIAQYMSEFRADSTPGMPIVDQRQFDRLADYLATTSGEIACGGRTDRDAFTIEPTVIVDPHPDDAVMTEEIFGPILPVLGVDSLDAALSFINARPKPLAMYGFTRSRETGRRIIDGAAAGSTVLNHVAVQLLVPQLPFGGVGASGMGAYHGEWGFQTLSHRKAVLSKSVKPDLSLMYPPYSDSALRILRRIL